MSLLLKKGELRVGKPRLGTAGLAAHKPTQRKDGNAPLGRAVSTCDYPSGTPFPRSLSFGRCSLRAKMVLW